MRICCTLLVIILHSLCVIGQQSGADIIGRVTDKSTNQPLEFANVLLLNPADTGIVTGVVTDKKGKFKIENVKPGSYFLRFSFIGFDSAQSKAFTILPAQKNYSLGEIALGDEAKKLDEVIVTGRKSALNTSIDRKIYNVEQDIMSRSGSASDILKNIPSVEVDIEGQVTLRGSGDVMILINGKPSPLMGKSRAEVLQQLPANSIERIEVITNPSARYRPDGTSGIINIVLKKNTKIGWNGTVIGNAGNRDRYNANLTLNYNPQKVNLFGSYSIRKDFRQRFNTIDRVYLDSAGKPSSFYDELITSFARPLSNIANVGVDYNLNEKNAFGISGSYYHRKMIRQDVSEKSIYSTQNILEEKFDRLRKAPEFEKQYSVAAYFEHRFTKEDHEVRIEFNSSKSDEEGENQFTNIYYLPSPAVSFDNTLIKEGDTENQLTVDYTNPLTEDSKLEAGYDGFYNDVDLNFYGEYFDTIQARFVKDMIKSNQFLYKAYIHAFYATYQRSYEAFGYSLGFRAEQVGIKGNLVTLDSLINNTYFKLYPTIHLSYELSESSELQLNYSKRVNRPDADELNPFPEYQDPRNLRAGNPKLLPEIIHSFELGYKLQNKNFSIVPSLYYRHKRNGFTSVIIPLNDSTLLTTEQNLSQDHSAGLELIFSAKSGKLFNANFSTNIFYNSIDASNLGFGEKKSIVTMSSNLNMNFIFTQNTMLQVSGNYRAARLTPQGKLFPTFVANLGARQDFLKNKLSLTLTISDIFKSLKQKTEFNPPFFLQTTTNKRDGRIIYLGLNYRFGSSKKNDREDKIQFDDSL